MDGSSHYFDLAAEVLQKAMKAGTAVEQAPLLEEALRLNRLALAEERKRLAGFAVNQQAADPAPAQD